MAEISNILCVDDVVLTMGADEPDIDHAIRIVDPHDDTILVTGDVEDRTAVFENAGAADISLDVRGLCPIGLLHLAKPRHHRLAGIGDARAKVEKGLDRAERYHPHGPSLTWSRFGTKDFLSCPSGRPFYSQYI